MGTPITWVHRDRGNGAKQVRTRQPDGSVVIDKYPCTAPPDKDSGLPRGYRRWEKLVDAAGNVVRPCLTEASSSYDKNSAYAQLQRAKWKANGWIYYGECPKASVMVGSVDPFSLIPGNRTGEPCPRGTFDMGEARDSLGPCKCVKAEIEARQLANKRAMERLEGKYKNEQSKALESQMQSAQNASVSMETLAATMAQQTQLIAQLAQAATGGTAAAPAPAAKKKAKAVIEAEAEETDE